VIYISDGTWFVEGTEATLIDDYRPQIQSGLFRGQRRCDDPAVEGHPRGEVYEDEEVCAFCEFAVVEVPR
jgi:hypothetical protein